MPTQVPNSGYVDKVYFNTNLSIEEVVSLISGLIYYTLENQPITYSILASSDWLHTLNITNENGNYTILKYNRETNDLTIIWTNYEYSGDNLSGWREVAKNAISFECEVTNTGGTFDVGAENDKLTQLISITPFEEPIALKPFLKGIADAIREKKKTTELINAQNFASEILSIKGGLIEVTELPEVGEEDSVYKLLGSAEGTTVPSGKLTNIYFNNNLSIDEVVSIIESANLGYSTDGLIPNSYLIAQCLMIIKNENDYGIMYIHSDGEGSADFNNIEVIFSSANTEGVDFVGWNPNFKNPIEYEYDNTIESSDTAISKNEALKDLVSSTPFKEEKIPSETYHLFHESTPQVVPNSGMVEKIYFNTALGVEEVVSILEQLTYSTDSNINGTEAVVVVQTIDYMLNIYKVLEMDAYIIIRFESLTPTILFMSKDLSNFNSAYNFVGWSPTLTNPYVVNQESTLTDDFVSQNNKLTQLISTTPFPYYEQISGGILEVDNLPKTGEDNYVYKMQSVLTAIPYMNVEGIGIFNFIEYARQNGGSCELVDVVDSKDQLPTDNIKVSNGETESYFYYVRKDNYYVYGQFGDDGAKIWVTISTLMGMPFVGEITNVSEITELNSMYALVSGGDSADYYIYENSKPTQVLTTGLIENLYFNTKLSIEETDAILSQLTYDYDGYAYVVGAYEKGSGYGNIVIVEANAFTQGQIPSGYIIGHMHDTTDMTKTEFIYMSNQGLVDLALTLGINTKVGWNMEALNLNQTFNGAFGTENDKLINVISTTPYPYWTKISGGGATVKATPEVVPNTGFVERIYLNKSLSFDEVNAICTKANSFVANELVPIYGVVSNDTFDKQLVTFKLTDHDGTTFNSIHYPNLGNVIWSERDYYNEEKDGSITQFKKGWMFEEDYVEINGEVVSVIEGDFAINVGQHNDQLTELFSINNVFETNEIKVSGEYDGSTITVSNMEVEGTAIPILGKFENIYLNTKLSIEEVNEILKQITYTPATTEGEPDMYIVLQTLDSIIRIFDYNGSYAIMVGMNVAYVSDGSFASAGATFVGWSPELTNPYVVNQESNADEYNTYGIGEQNEKLTKLLSITPFEEKPQKNFDIDIKSLLEQNKLPLSVKVNVESQEPNLQEKEITENGEYVADEGYDGFSKVTVNVGGGEDMLQAMIDATNSCSYLFYKYSGNNIEFIKNLDTSRVTDIKYMCESSLIRELPPLDIQNVTNANYMCNNCSYLEIATLLNTFNVTRFNTSFSGCYKLKTIATIDMRSATSNYATTNMFSQCKALENLTLLNIKQTLEIGSGTSWGHLLTLESLINTVKECINVGSAKTLTMGTANLEKIASTYVKFTDSSVTTIPTNEKGDVVVCESTDEGAMLLQDYALLKNWTLA